MLLTLLAEGGDPNICRIDGASPLWIAAQMGHDHIVRVLLKSGARVDAVRCVSWKISISAFGKIVDKLNLNQMCCFSFVVCIGRCNAIVQGGS